MPDESLFAFVLMPFSDDFQDIYKLGIKAVAFEKGVIAERVDEQFYTESILERIYRQIDTADFIIADMTGRNPNVFYEVGYAHAKGKVCTLITKTADDIPFDLKHHRHLIYNGSITDLNRLLSEEIDWIKASLELQKTKTFEINVRPQNEILKKYDTRDTGNFDLLIDIHNHSNVRSPEIDAIYMYTSDRWQIEQDGKMCPSTASDRPLVTKRHMLTSQATRLAPGAWTQIKCT